jgi:hypothetical protein
MTDKGEVLAEEKECLEDQIERAFCDMFGRDEFPEPVWHKLLQAPEFTRQLVRAKKAMHAHAPEFFATVTWGALQVSDLEAEPKTYSKPRKQRVEICKFVAERRFEIIMEPLCLFRFECLKGFRWPRVWAEWNAAHPEDPSPGHDALRARFKHEWPEYKESLRRCYIHNMPMEKKEELLRMREQLTRCLVTAASRGATVAAVVLEGQAYLDRMTQETISIEELIAGKYPTSDSRN